VVRAYDPVGMEEAARHIDGVAWYEDAYEAMAGADAVVVLTEWNEFRGLSVERMKQNLAYPVMIDLRNIYEPKDMAAAGFRYTCVGRPASEPEE
jgi:UDPglucose 6-dehydrogenase